MKRAGFLFVVFILTGIVPASSYHPNLPVNTLTAARGAATVAELANVVFTALQSNDFGQLPLYVPTDDELNALKKRSSEDMQAVIEGLTAEAVAATLKESFDTVVREGLSKMLNLNELTLADVRTGNPGPKNKMLLPVTATLTTRTNQTLPLRFETLKINGRYFLFQRLEWQSVN